MAHEPNLLVSHGDTPGSEDLPIMGDPEGVVGCHVVLLDGVVGPGVVGDHEGPAAEGGGVLSAGK